MKNTIKHIALLLLAFSFTLISCEKETDPLDDNNPATGDCMEFVALGDDYDDIIYLEFIDNTNGWAIGQIGYSSYDLLNTTDGGTSWNVINTDFQMDFDNGFMSGEALQFVSATNGIKRTNYSSEDKLKIQYTTDKGATWHDYDNTWVDINGDPDQNYGIPSFFASNGTETILLCGGTTYAAGWTYKTMMTIDNATMDVVSSVNEHYDSSWTYPVTIDRMLHYAQDGTITAMVTQNSDTTGDLFIAQSNDKGESWTFTSEVLDGEYFRSTSWVNDNTGYIAVGYYSGAKNLYKTLDGGATWSLVNTDPPKFQMIRFADETHGIGVTDFDFYYTTDAGVSWTEIEVCKNSDGQYNMGYDEVLAYPSVDNGWVAGSKYYEDFTGSTEGVFNFIGE